MSTVRTFVNESKLEEWCRALPDCAEFMGNFFGSCQPYDYFTNLSNYLADIENHLEIKPQWEQYKDRLVIAFVQITYTPDIKPDSKNNSKLKLQMKNKK